MSIRIKKDDVITLLGKALLEQEALVEQAKEGLKKAHADDLAARKKMVAEIKKHLSPNDLTRGWGGSRVSISYELKETEWPEEGWYKFDAALNVANERLAEVKELIKLINLTAEATVNVTSKVFGNLARYL